MYSFQPRCISPLYCLVGLGKKWGLIFSGAPALWPLLGPMFPIVPVWRGATLLCLKMMIMAGSDVNLQIIVWSKEN